MSMNADTRAAVDHRRSEHGGTFRQALAYVMAERAAKAWNAAHPGGTPVTVAPYGGCRPDELIRTKTRSAAWVISGHASVLVEGKSGGYGLEFVKVAS